MQYRNENSAKGLKRVVKEYCSGWITSADDARTLLKSAMQQGFVLNRYDGSIASEAMKSEMLKEYCTNTKESLKKISEKLGKKYGMRVSAGTVRKYARCALGDGSIKRSDGSAARVYANRK